MPLNEVTNDGMRLMMDGDAAVVLALHRPDAGRLRRLLHSLVEQEGVSTRIYAAATAEDLARPDVAALLAGCSAQCLERPDGETIRQRFLGVLTVALDNPAHTAFAFCDQDDVWHRTKLSRSLAPLRQGAALVHSDARVVTADGRLLAPSLHAHEGRREGACQADCLIRNTVSGFTAVLSRTLAARLTVVSPCVGPGSLHDHLASVVAWDCGGVTFVPEALADYVQHTENVVGAVAPSPLLGGWLGDIGAFRARSAQLFQQRAEVARALGDQGWADPETGALFGIGRPVSRSAWMRLMLRQIVRGDGRRLRDGLRLMDGALGPHAPRAGR